MQFADFLDRLLTYLSFRSFLKQLNKSIYISRDWLIMNITEFAKEMFAFLNYYKIKIGGP